MFEHTSVRFRGPLTPFASSFWSELIEKGYSPLSAMNLLRLAAHFSRWLDDRALEVGDLDEKGIAKFLKHRRRKGYTAFLSPRGLQPLVDHLRDLNVVPAAPEPAKTPLERFLWEYSEYLAQERGLSSSTIRQYADFAQSFICTQFGGDVLGLSRLTAADVTRFVSFEFRCSSIGECKHIVTYLRSLLRYLHVRGLLTHSISSCVPAVASSRLAPLPNRLEPKQVEEVLAACDPQTLVGRRNRAVLCLLVRLGLRTGEVSRLRLEDINWRAAELVVRGKGRRDSRLPLPNDVGKAIAAYLRRRPTTEHRAVFLCVRAPHRAITPSAISSLARQALRAAGISAGSAHILRHTAATQMLRGGASLAEVGHVLRHRHVSTTAIYAKIDDANLRLLARPWPGGAA